MKQENERLRQENQRLKAQVDMLLDEKKEMEIKFDTLKKENKLLDPLKYAQWSSDDLIHWILSLENNRFVKYEQQLRKIFNEQEIDGSCLDNVIKTDLTEWGIKNFKDKSNLFDSIQNLIADRPLLGDHEGMNTAYIQ